MNANPAQEHPQCKNVIISSQKPTLSSQKMGVTSSSTPSNERPESEVVPTWGSNLLAVNERTDDTPKCEVTSSVKNPELSQSMDAVEQFADEFQKGVLTTQSIRVNQNDIGNSLTESNQDRDIKKKEPKDDSVKEDTSSRPIPIQDDAQIITYFRQQLEEYKHMQRIKLSNMIRNRASPAKAGIPITTPKSSPVPKRPNGPIDDDEDATNVEASEEESNEELNLDDDSEDEYREWEMRLKEVQRVLEQNLKYIKGKKTTTSNASSSHE